MLITARDLPDTATAKLNVASTDIADRILAAAHAVVRAGAAVDAMDRLPGLEHLSASTQVDLLNAKQALSTANENAWCELQDLCFAHNVSVADALTLAHIQRRAEDVR